MAVGDPFEAIVELTGSRPVVALRGELDASTAPAFERAIAEVLDHVDGLEELIVDLAHLTFIDSSGLNVLVGAANRIHTSAAAVVVVNASPAARRLFSISGIERVITVR